MPVALPPAPTRTVLSVTSTLVPFTVTPVTSPAPAASMLLREMTIEAVAQTAAASTAPSDAVPIAAITLSSTLPAGMKLIPARARRVRTAGLLVDDTVPLPIR